MNKKHSVSRLGLQLIAAVVLSLTAGAVLFFLLTMASYRGISSVTMNPEHIARQEAASAERLQRYVTTHDIGLSQIKRLDEWSEEEKNVLITVYQGQEILYYNTDVVIGLPDSDTIVYDEAAVLQESSYDIVFRDGIAEVVLISFFDSRYYLWADFLNGMISIAVSLAILYACIRRKVRYIALLASELQILKGGDLNYPITVKGKDELSALAEEMDAMRRAIRERQQEKERAIQANQELVTAMSHDLRTPLTSLLGYVDILNLHKYQEGQQEKYLHAIGEKAWQIKQISDKLFEYFLVFRREREEIQLQTVNGIEFLGQVVEESLFDMESEGFQIERRTDEITCVLQIDVEAIRRVFGNIFSNLIKYADRSQPIQVSYGQQPDSLKVSFRNAVAGKEGKESSQIGLRTCEKIMEDHGGRFRYKQENGQFEVYVEFPVKIPKNYFENPSKYSPTERDIS